MVLASRLPLSHQTAFPPLPGRTKAVLSEMPLLLLELWREQHPEGHEQTALDFGALGHVALVGPLFKEDCDAETVCKEEFTQRIR